VTVAVAVTVATSMAHRGMRFAMLIGAVHVAPTHFLSFFTLIFTALAWSQQTAPPPFLMLPWVTLVSSALALVAVGLIAHTAHHAETMSPRLLRNRIMVLVVLAVAHSWSGLWFSAVVGWMQGSGRGMPLTSVLVGPLMMLPWIVVPLGFVWLFARWRLSRHPSEVAGG
jgi:hypothetical protein